MSKEIVDKVTNTGISGIKARTRWTPVIRLKFASTTQMAGLNFQICSRRTQKTKLLVLQPDVTN